MTDNEKLDHIIKTLKTEVDILIRKNETLKDEKSELQAEIERLTEENKKQKAVIEQIENDINPLPFVTDFDLAMKNTRAEAIKEFTKMLEDISTERLVFEGYGENKVVNIVEYGDIYNLMKKLTEKG